MIQERLEANKNYSYENSINSELRDVTCSGESLDQVFELPDTNFRERSNTASRFLDSVSRTFRGSSLLGNVQEVVSDDRSISAFVAGWNVINLIQGIGILGIPYAFCKGGWVAVVITVIMAMVCCFTGHLLIDCLYTMCPVTGKRTRYLKSYSCVGAKVWPKFGRQLVSIVCVTEMFGGLVLYVVLLATMSTKLLKPLTLPWNRDLDMYYWSTIVTYSSLPLLFITKLSVISWFSLIAVIGLFSTTISVFVFLLMHVRDIRLDQMPEFNIETFPIAVGIIVFSYCAHAVFPGIEESMKKPAQYSAMMKVSFSIAAVIKTVIGVLAVLLFGAATHQEVTADITNSVIANVIPVLVLVNVFFSVPLVSYVVVERFDAAFRSHFHPWFQKDGPMNFGWMLITRALVLTVALFVAMLVPHFALLMGVVGSVTGTCLCFIFPCWFHLKLNYNNLNILSKMLRIVIMCVGFVSGGCGLAFSTLELVNSFK